MTETVLTVFDMLTADNCCALLVDHRPGLYPTGGDITEAALRNNSIALGKVLHRHNPYGDHIRSAGASRSDRTTSSRSCGAVSGHQAYLSDQDQLVARSPNPCHSRSDRTQESYLLRP